MIEQGVNLSSNTTGTTSAPETEAKPKSNLKIIAIAIVIIAIIIGAFLTYWWLSKPQTAWLFKGAYATYKGTTSSIMMSMNLTIREEVVDFNSTHAKLLTTTKIEMPYMGSMEYENTTCVDLSKNDFMMEGANMTKTYEADVNVEGLGNKRCIVYEYKLDSSTMTVYVDKGIGWPVKFKYSMSGFYAYIFELKLTETNIPRLK